MNPTEKYTDALLDNKFETIQNEMRGLRDLPLAMGRLEGKVDRVQDDTGNCHKAVRELREDFEAYQEQERNERRSALRWTITTIIAASGAIVGALSYLSDKT